LPQPTLQRTCAGDIELAFLKQDTDQAAAPTGMLLPHFDGLLKRGALGRHLLGRAAGIAGSDPLLAEPSEAAHQMTHGAFAEIQVCRKTGRRFAGLPSSQNELSEGQGNGGWHEIILRE
jgi:hypothetical protein